ncbi:uncharacterized protein MONBRDRAFT_24230 [Monosiga brevicollis MX1]|uniref:Reverse transcriptase domain-containing protein n=1 Tax=Monosiga brevicollis TaxID=81824 RepID=A9UVS9_MONBE|nr:uncharacterized protein MONBRDRAFT_24230 [Monosiga brevicollis MX1]EDQ90445.1 predicted protein [Monosiga brevicollis MX1]|eukprot:XP_001744496.1 hypothetical protein [Monosiga brevicollis MX1]
MAFGELQACESTPGWTMLSLDFKSAFNYTDRARLHEIVADKVPGLLRAFERHYARPTTHCIVDKFFKVIDIDVGQGIVQGNELSPFFFALYSCGVLGLRDATTDYRCKVIKYLDDIVLMGPAEDVAADVEIIKARAESAGLHLQPSKSRFYMPRHHPASITAIKSVLPDAVRETANTGMTVLGTPIGRREWMKKQLNDKAKHIAGKLNDMLTIGVSLQALLTAMQYVPSLINHLYTLPPSLTSGLSELLNRACKDTFVKAFFAKSGYNANGQSCRIDLHCRNPFPGGALGPALPDLGIDVTVRTAQPPTTSQACIKVGAALRRAEKEKRDYYTGFNHGKTLIVPAAMTTTGGFASSFVDLLGQLARCAEARGVYQPGLDEAFVPRWKGRFAALVHQMNADHIQRHFGGVCLRSS